MHSDKAEKLSAPTVVNW